MNENREEKLNGKTALVVDDDMRNVFALVSFLEQQDMKVLQAENGITMLQVLEEQAVDIILLDMMMPVMDGYEALAKLAENKKLKQIPVIAVTAQAMKGDKEKCMAAGAWDYVPKPIDLHILRKKLFDLIP